MRISLAVAQFPNAGSADLSCNTRQAKFWSSYMLAEFSLVRFQVQTGKKGKPPLMVLPNLPLPSHQMEALAVAQYRFR